MKKILLGLLIILMSGSIIYAEADVVGTIWNQENNKAVLAPDITGGIDFKNVSGFNLDGVVTPDSIDTFTNKLIKDASNDIHADAVHIISRNVSGSAIAAGSPVYASGYNVGQAATEIDLADADDPSTMPAIGITDGYIANNSNGHVIASGVFDSMSTAGWNVGDVLYVSTTPGILTDTKPVGDNDLIQAIVKVLRSHNTAGQILVQGAGRTNAVPNGSVTFSNITIKNNVTFLGYSGLLGIDGNGNAFSAEAGGGTYIYDFLRDEKPQNTAGGTFTASGWRLRALTIGSGLFTHISSNSQFILEDAGTYIIEWDAPANFVGKHQSRLYNFTNATTMGYGSSESADASTVINTITSSGGLKFTSVEPLALGIEHRCTTTRNTDGFGSAVNLGPEVFTRIKALKEP